MVGEFKRLKKITDQEMKCLQLCRVWHMFITQAAITFQIKRYERAVESGFFVWKGGGVSYDGTCTVTFICISLLGLNYSLPVYVCATRHLSFFILEEG